MTILHIAEIDDNPCSGVNVVVPNHIIHQQKTEKVGIINLANCSLKGIDSCFIFTKYRLISQLPTPFNNPDLIVIHQTYHVANLLFAKEANKRGIPYILIPHGDLSKEAQSKKCLKKRLGNLVFYPILIRKAIAIQFLSQVEKNSSVFASDKDFVMPNGITIQNRNNKKHIISDLRVTYIGRIDVFHKGLDLMLESIAKLFKANDLGNTKISIYGPNSQILEPLIIEYDLEKLVSIGPKVVGNDKEEVLNNSDIFIQTSRFEGMPMGILEALSFGIPVLITEGTTLGSLVRKYDAGWVAETNVESIVKALKCCISETSEFERKSENAFLLAKEQFDWSVVSKKTINKYREIVSKK